MSVYLGDYKEDEPVYFLWSTNDSSGASITRATNGTVSVYKDNGVTQTTTGVTDTEDFDSLTGIHACSITTTDAFYVTGADYAVVLSAATIDGQTVNAVLAHFSIENRSHTHENSDIHSRLVVVEASIDSDQILITSDTSDILSKLTVWEGAAGVISNIESGLNVVEAAVANGTLSDITSKLVVLKAETALIVSDTSDIRSQQVLQIGAGGILSDMASGVDAIQAAGGSLTGAQDSKLTEIWTDVNDVISDTSDIESKLTNWVGAGGILSDMASGVDAIQAAGGALTGAQDSKLTEIHGDVNNIETAIDSDTASQGTIISDIHSKLVMWSGTGVISDIYSDTDAIKTLLDSWTAGSGILSDINSGVNAIQAGGGSLTAAQDSKLTQVHSDTLAADIVSMSSSVEAIEAAGGALTGAQDSKLTEIHGDVNSIASDTAVIETRTSDTHSRLVVVEAAIDSDTASAATKLDNIDSQVTATDSQLTVTDAVVDQNYSRLQVVEAAIDSDTASAATKLDNIDSQVTATDSQLTVTDAVVDQNYSRLQVVEAAIDSDTASAATVLTNIDSQVTATKSHAVVIQSETTAIQSQLDVTDAVVDTIASDAALLEAAHAEPTGVPAANESPLDKLGYLFMLMRNKVTVTSSKKTVFGDDDVGEFEYDLTDAAGTTTKSEANAI